MMGGRNTLMDVRTFRYAVAAPCVTILVAALRTVRRLTGGSRGFSEYIALGPTFWDFAESHRWKFSCFFWGLGLSGFRILPSYFWGQRLYFGVFF